MSGWRGVITTRYERIVEGPVFFASLYPLKFQNEPISEGVGGDIVWYRFPFNQLLVSFPREIDVVCGQSGILMARPWPMISQDKGKRYLRPRRLPFHATLARYTRGSLSRIGDKFWSNCTLCRGGFQSIVRPETFRCWDIVDKVKSFILNRKWTFFVKVLFVKNFIW